MDMTVANGTSQLSLKRTNDTEQAAFLAEEVLKVIRNGNDVESLHYLNLCLDKEYRKKDKNSKENCDSKSEDSTSLGTTALWDSDSIDTFSSDLGISSAEFINLLEMRCLVNLKLRHFEDVLNDGRKILDTRTDHSLAYKCLLVALCKTKRLEQVNEILKLWRSYSPKDLGMMECRTKLEGLMLAVKNGIEPDNAFSKVEDLLGLSYDWLLSRKSQDPNWKFRPVPAGQNSFVLCLHYRFGVCSLGEKCPDAHGELELEEWKVRCIIKNITSLLDNIKLDSGEIYVRRLLEKVQEAGDRRCILSDAPVEGLKIKCSKSLETTVYAKKGNNSVKWTFAVETKKPLTYICLLYELHRPYFQISSAVIHGAGNKINLMAGSKSDASTQVLEISSPNALAIPGKKSGSFTYKLDVVFKPDVYGTFRQTIVFDCGEEIKAVRNVSVEVVPLPEKNVDGQSGDLNEKSSPTFDLSSSYRAGVTWNFGNAEVVDGVTGEKVASSKLGFALINGMNKPEANSLILKQPLTMENYKEQMRFFLTQEERARQEILAKYNVTAPLSMMQKYIMTAGYNEGMTKYSLDGTLYGRMTLFRDVSEDTAVGRLILRSCNFLLLTTTEEARKTETNTKPRVYLCPISDKTKNAVYIDLGKTIVSELNLKDEDITSFDIQFQLDRTAFMEMKAVIDKLEDFHLRMLFPDFNLNYHIPWTPIKQWSIEAHGNVRLNPRQKEALIAITAESNKIPPILVIGPFGTGKTFTLAQCIRKLLTQPNIRIMVCTHSNSAADLYIKEYLDPWYEDGFKAARPLRIYYSMRNLNSVHPTVAQYCKIDKLRFRPPTLQEVLDHRVIVVTLSTSYILMEMNLPKDTFSHILLDEAAQAMESEAITPLMSAGENTKLVLAGDHMQLSPELFSEEAKSLHPSFLERLHCSYPDNHPCKLMLCENYRSHSAIIEYVSEAFYTKKLECGMDQPVHDTFYPMTFFAARGEEVQDSDSTSYYNNAEVFEVADKVKKLIHSWPAKWGDPRSESSIGVLTPYSDQVTRIRSQLRKNGLNHVSVERVLNVQGKQFRVVFLSTVRSFRPWVRILPEAVGNEVDLGFFSNPKLLNTAFTRAQSLVAVVGDPVSLCSVGKCRNLWDDFIKICDKNKSLNGITYLQLQQYLKGVEMRLTWGLNPLANEFEPQSMATRNASVKVPTKTPRTMAQAFQQTSIVSSVPATVVPQKILPPSTSSIGAPTLSHPHVSNIRPPPIPLQPRNINPSPGFPAAPPPPFQNPGNWPHRLPLVPVQPPPVVAYGGYYPTPPVPISNPNQMVYPIHGYPGPGPRTVIPLNIQPQAILPVVPPPFLAPSVATRPFIPPPGVGPYSSNVMPHPSLSGQQFTQSNFSPLGQIPATIPSSHVPISNSSHSVSSLIDNTFSGLNGHSSPQPPTFNSSYATNPNFRKPVPSYPVSDNYSAGVPLYRRTPASSNQQSQQHQQQSSVLPNQQTHMHRQNMNSNNIFNSEQSPVHRHIDLTEKPISQPHPMFSADEMLLLDQMFESYSATSGSLPDDAHSLHSKLREAVNIARGLSDGPAIDTNTTNLRGPSSQNTWGSNNLLSSNNFPQSHQSQSNQRASDFPISGSVSDIWSAFSVPEERVPNVSTVPSSFLNSNNNNTSNNSTFGASIGFEKSVINQLNPTSYGLNISNSYQSENVMPSSVRKPEPEIDLTPWSRDILYNPREQSSFEHLSSQQQPQLNYGDVAPPGFRNTNSLSNSSDVTESASSGTGRSYANVVKRAATTAAVGAIIPSNLSSGSGMNSIARGGTNIAASAYFNNQNIRQQSQQTVDQFQQYFSSDPNTMRNMRN